MLIKVNVLSVVRKTPLRTFAKVVLFSIFPLSSKLIVIKKGFRKSRKF